MKYAALMALLFVNGGQQLTHWHFHVDTLAAISVLKCDGEYAQIWTIDGMTGLPNPIPNKGSSFEFSTLDSHITVANFHYSEPPTLIMSNCDQPLMRFR